MDRQIETKKKTDYRLNYDHFQVQIKGNTIGSTICGVIAGGVLQKLGKEVLRYPPKFWAEYVDDTFDVIKRLKNGMICHQLNSLFPDNQFKR